MTEHITGFDLAATEAAIVVTVRPDGSYDVRADGVCKIVAAELLCGIADRLVVEHELGRCTPADARPRGDEAADQDGGRLDRPRKVWRTARGDAFDLSLTWADWTEREWRWHGTVGQFGEPIMRAEGDDEVLPFDLLHALYGPITPMTGGAA